MKVIDILSDNQHFAGMPRLQLGQRKVCDVGLSIAAVGAAHVVEFVNNPRVTSEGLRRGHVLKIIVRPETVLIPEGAETGFG